VMLEEEIVEDVSSSEFAQELMKLKARQIRKPIYLKLAASFTDWRSRITPHNHDWPEHYELESL
jgi:hypothetical protein